MHERLGAREAAFGLPPTKIQAINSPAPRCPKLYCQLGGRRPSTTCKMCRHDSSDRVQVFEGAKRAAFGHPPITTYAINFTTPHFRNYHVDYMDRTQTVRNAAPQHACAGWSQLLSQSQNGLKEVLELRPAKAGPPCLRYEILKY